MTALILYFSLALVVSFCCSLLEAVILSLSHGHIETLIEENPKSGKVLKKLKARIDRPLAAILTVNTVANTIGAAGVGAQALKLANEAWPDSSNNKWVAIASGILTICILVFSEIIPKTLGAVYWKRLASITAFAVRGLIYAMYPIVVSSEALARLISPKEEQARVSRAEMLASAEISATDGMLGKQEIRIIRNLFCLNQVRAKDVLTPRSVLQAFPQELTVGDVVTGRGPLRFSRMPIYGKDLDDITGFVLRHDLLTSHSQGRLDLSLAALSKPIHAVPDTASIAAILDQFIQRREQLFLAVDEYGGTAGIITLEDAIETLLGVEIVDELDSVTDMRQLAKQMWQYRRSRGETRNLGEAND